MAITITYRPLTQWPAGRERTPDAKREHGQFKAPWTTTLVDLEHELSMIKASDIVLQVDIVGERDLRHDGTVRSDAKTKSPAVVLSFKRQRLPLVFATDWFRSWEDNARAIALGLDGLRRLERYHIGQSGDQYRGWLALPGAGGTVATLSTEQAAHLIARLAAPDHPSSDRAAFANQVLDEVLSARDWIRSAKARTHPDAGGRNEDWTLLQEAERIITAHHGGKL